jgi:hypothetical protein
VRLLPRVKFVLGPLPGFDPCTKCEQRGYLVMSPDWKRLVPRSQSRYPARRPVANGWQCKACTGRGWVPRKPS